MTHLLKTPYFTFDHHEIDICRSEHLCYDDNLAREVAQPLFDAGIRTIGLTERSVYNPSPDLGAPPYHFFALVLQGEMVMLLEDGFHTMKPGDWTCCPMGGPHRLSIQDVPSQWIYIQVHDEPVWESLKQRKPYIRHYESAPLLFLLLRDILAAKARPGPLSTQLALKNSHALVNLLRQELLVAGAKPAKRSDNLEQLVSQIRQSPGDDWSRDRIASELHVSVRQLTRLFKREFGVSPKDFVIRQRMDLAAQLLLNTDTKIESIAFEVGYDSVYSFTRLFTKFIGLSPGKYRSQFGPPQP